MYIHFVVALRADDQNFKKISIRELGKGSTWQIEIYDGSGKNIFIDFISDFNCQVG